MFYTKGRIYGPPGLRGGGGHLVHISMFVSLAGWNGHTSLSGLKSCCLLHLASLNPWLPSTAPSNWLYTVSKLNYENKGFAVIIIQRVHHQNRTWVLAIEVKLTCYAFYVHTYPFCTTCTINVPITLTVLLFHAHLHYLYHLRC